MTKRINNFSAGPAILPVEVLEEARDNMLSLGDTGIGIMEHSHRGKAFIAVLEQVEADCRKLANISDDYSILFLQGGASSQFFMVPMNFLEPTQTADYLLTGSWAQKAAEQATRYGKVHTAASSKDRNFAYIPKTATYSEKPAYVHFTSNNTIFGTQWAKEPETPKGSTLICDASSDIFCRPLDVSKYGMIYAGAQKNLGPSGVTLVILRKDLMGRGKTDLPEMLQYRIHADNESCYNTPPTFGIYFMGLVFKWILKQGGLEAVGAANTAKANVLYQYLDKSSMFRATADADSRSLMNVTFVTGKEDVDNKFISEAKKAGFDGLKGHRSVGGMRASIYNAFPKSGCEELVAFMGDFEKKNG
ncbi:3-phosphoserine/phosphohydroxythreonine transaminase [Planctomicrobium piriforme]|uniref:Phosphoserine aminotransferase n=1 Tax=Planctomicrobium piriforme TaxID=1576369 RepID=A0A1I3BEG5_9PLAN|nr:3-phosphoserine/phosphohydroxythreonine transaminase [Planctomicrobium piriforme]SFH60091.1 phosphoserine aminotransferase apoenzyme [Planctomicrobium piriforme]